MIVHGVCSIEGLLHHPNNIFVDVVAGDKLDHLYPTIRYKLANALTSWSPSDGSAHGILKPWVDVFTPPVMEVFLTKTIIPKLAYCSANHGNKSGTSEYA